MSALGDPITCFLCDGKFPPPDAAQHMEDYHQIDTERIKKRRWGTTTQIVLYLPGDDGYTSWTRMIPLAAQISESV